MCSFLFTNKEILDLDSTNLLLKKRGPDHTNIVKDGEFTYLHNLLSITGSFTPQPIKKNDFTLLYNGEIYNYSSFGEYRSDGECILDLFIESGVDSFNLLDGEFSIFLQDRKRNKIYLVSDTFGTKPLYYSIEDGKIGVSSYPDPLSKLGFSSPRRIEPNKIIIINSKDFSVEESKDLYSFSLNQNKNNFDHWCIAFDDAIRKRTAGVNHRVIVPMSSGYDSGAICCSLNKIDYDYISYTIMGCENPNIISSRLSINKNRIKEIIHNITPDERQSIVNKFGKEIQPFYYGPSPDEITHIGSEDPGAIGLYYLLELAKRTYGVKIILSGQGSDEMMSNIQTYGFKTKNPESFPSDISGIFPWGNFYYGSQWSYLMKEECIAGSLGIETRYPFLDRRVVQEYLNLSNDLKNQSYKSPLKDYLSRNYYPFSEEKIGFNI
jgi:asparagine synthetase B (glutamine-hydrolysing)